MKNKIPGAIILEGHIQGLSNTRSLGGNGIPVYVLDVGKCIASSSRFCMKFFICPDFQSEAFIDFLIDLSIKENLVDWVLIPSNDHIVLNLANNKKRLESCYKVITPELDIIKNIYDKASLLKIADKQSLPYPLTQYFESETDPIIPDLRFPVLTKGRNGLSFYKTFKRKTFLSRSEEELKTNLGIIKLKFPLSETFTQELIPANGTNKTISFTAFCVKGDIKTYWMGVKLREHPICFGTATFAGSVYIKKCYEQSIILLKSLHYTGVCEIEYLKDPRSGEYMLIEVNSRTWLWVGLAKECGVDYAKLIYDFVNGNEIVYPSSYDTDKYWINPITDFVFSFPAIFLDKLGLIEYLRSFVNARVVNALFVKGDMKPGFNYLKNLVSISKKR